MHTVFSPEQVRKSAKALIRRYSNCYLLWQHVWDNYSKKWSKNKEQYLIKAMEIFEEEWTPIHEAHKETCEIGRTDALRAYLVFDGIRSIPDSGIESVRVRREIRPLSEPYIFS